METIDCPLRVVKRPSAHSRFAAKRCLSLSKQVAPERVRELYADLGSKQKIFIDLACSSHNAMWEKNHLLLFQASLEWLKDGKVNGTAEGVLKLGY